jgi:hypothetical protein
MKKWILTSAALLQLGTGAVKAQDNTLSAAEQQEAFTLLFDGTLDSFKKNFVDYVKGNTTNTNLSSSWSVNTDKVLTLGARTNDARSVKTYKDVDWRMDFRINGNEGIFYRTLINTDKAWETGVEFAINDYTDATKDAPGAAYDLYAPNPNTYNLFASGKWNTVRIVIKADSVEHWMNGKKVVGYKYHSDDFWVQYNASKWNSASVLTNKVGGNRNSGYIDDGYLGFQADHGGNWQLKNMRIQSVTKDVCFGPLKQDGHTACYVPTAIDQTGKTVSRLPFSSLRNPNGIAVSFPEDVVQGATLVGMDGRALAQGVITQGGSKAEFAGAFKTGVYFLRLNLASGQVTQKLNLL